MGTFDAEAAWYLDLEHRRVVRVRGGVVSDPDLAPEDVDTQETRFVEIPAVTRGEEFLWMQDFLDEHPEIGASVRLDRRQDGDARFVKALERAAEGAPDAWRAFRRERLLEVASDWLGRTG